MCMCVMYVCSCACVRVCGGEVGVWWVCEQCHMFRLIQTTLDQFTVVLDIYSMNTLVRVEGGGEERRVLSEREEGIEKRKGRS